jgi:hypothetical protein
MILAIKRTRNSSEKGTPTIEPARKKNAHTISYAQFTTHTFTHQQPQHKLTFSAHNFIKPFHDSITVHTHNFTPAAHTHRFTRINHHTTNPHQPFKLIRKATVPIPNHHHRFIIQHHITVHRCNLTQAACRSESKPFSGKR